MIVAANDDDDDNLEERIEEPTTTINKNIDDGFNATDTDIILKYSNTIMSKKQ